MENITECVPGNECLHYFEGMGVRPAIWAVERDQYGDRLILIVGNDEPYLAKYDMPFDVGAFYPYPSETPVSDLIKAMAQPGGIGPAGRGEWSGIGYHDWPTGTGVTSPAPRPGDMPDLAPVPLSGSGLFLLLAFFSLIAVRTYRAKPAKQRLRHLPRSESEPT